MTEENKPEEQPETEVARRMKEKLGIIEQNIMTLPKCSIDYTKTDELGGVLDHYNIECQGQSLHECFGRILELKLICDGKMVFNGEKWVMNEDETEDGRGKS